MRKNQLQSIQLGTKIDHSITSKNRQHEPSSSNSHFPSMYIDEPSRIVFHEIRGYSINSAKVSRGKQRVETWPGHSLSAEFMVSWGGGRQRCRAGLTNVPRLNLKPPASRSLPVDYGLDKSFLENGRATPPSIFLSPFVSALARHPTPTVLSAPRLFTGFVFSR